MRLRWVTYKTRVTGEQVKAYAYENQLSMMDAKARLEAVVGPILQYLPDGGTSQDWTPVPFTVEYRE